MDLELFRMLAPEPVFATGIEIGLLGIGILLSAAAGALLSPKLTRNPVSRTTTNPVLAERGAFIPYLIGTFRLGCVFAWAGRPKSATSESGGFLGYGTTKTKVTSQAGWHLICVGPAKRLLHIYESGKIIFPIAGESALDSATTPSGTLIVLKSKRGQFKIYWGEANGPIDPLLASSGVYAGKGISVASRFPNVCYVVWYNKILSAPNQWPEMNYEVEVRPRISGNYITGTPWNDGTSLPPGRKNNGANPIHAITEMMLNTFPHGVGIPSANIDSTFFNAMQAVCTSEGLVTNVLVQDGNKASAAVNDVLSDIGGVIPQVGDKIIILLIRKETSVPIITKDALIAPLPEMVFVQGDRVQDRVTYVYKDRQLAYRDNDITIDDDSDQQGRSKSVQTPLNSVIDLDIGNIIVDRKQMENLVDIKTYKITGNRQLRALSPGQVFSTSDLGQLRITSVERPDLSASIVLECVQDIYSPVATTGNAAARERALVVDGYVFPDSQLLMWIVPYDLTPVGSNLSDTWVQFFPIRASNYTVQNNVYASFDVGAAPVYNLAIENTAFFVLGLLTQYVRLSSFALWDVILPVSSEAGQIEVNLYSFTLKDQNGLTTTGLLDFDIDIFPDLTNYPERWRNGENCCAIEDQNGILREVIYFKSISVSPNANCYYLNGILRNRMIKDTDPDSQYSGRVVLFRREDLNPVRFPNSATGALWSLSKILRAKTNAVGANGDIQLDEGFASTSKNVYLSFLPVPPSNFRSLDADSNFDRYSWASGATCTFKWSNRPLLVGTTDSAGRQLAGVAISASAIPFEGVLEIKIYLTQNDARLGTNLKRTFLVSSGITQAYTNGQQVTDSTTVAFYATYQVNFNGIKGAKLGKAFTAR